MKPTLPTCLSRQMTTRLVLFTLIFLGLGQTRGFAQVLFNYSNLTSGVGTVAAHIAPDTLTRGTPDIVQAADCMGDQGFGSHGWPTTNTFNVNTFNTNGWYVEFTLDPDPGYGLKVTGMSSRSRRENPAGTANDGPIAMRYGYSTDGGTTWTTVNPGNPQSSNICGSGGVNRIWPSWSDTLSSNPVIFRIYGLSSGSARDGDLFLRDVIVNGVVCANDPTIAPAPDFFSTCYGSTSVDYSYTSEEADTYSIDYDSLNFIDIAPGTPLAPGSGTISLSIPANTAPGDYTGTFTVTNSCGFSTDYGFTIEVKALPNVTISVSPTTICAGEDVTLSFADHAETGHLFSIVADLVDDNGISVGEINFSGIPSGASVVYTEGSDFDGDSLGVVSLTNIVVTDETTECVNDTEDDLTITVNPLPAAAISVLESSGTTENDGAICDGDNVVLTASGGVSYLWSPGGSTASAIAISPVVDITYTVIVTSADGCTATASQDITVNPLPDPTVSIASADICPGEEITFTLADDNYNGAQYNVSTSYTHVGGSVPAYDFAGPVGEGVLDTWTEGVDFLGDISFGPFTITEASSGCASTVSSVPVSVNVFEAASFEFTAATEGDGPYSGNNTTGPDTLDVNFCAGDHLTLSGYDDNGEIGYTVSYTSSGNVTYDGGAIPPVSGPSNVSPVNAPDFFGFVYGGVLGYGLSSGTSGTINQILVPYLDNDDSGDLSAGDCTGDTMFLNYHIHAIPNVDAVDDIAVCKGEEISIDFDGLVPNTDFNWTNDNVAIGLGASGVGDIPLFTTTNTGATDLVATIIVTPEANGCSGESETFTITVHPMPTFGFTATVAGRPAQVGSNAGGPATVTLDFCAGESFSYSGFSSSTANVGFIEEITGDSTNTLYGITPIPVPRPKTYISAGAAPGFFGGTYGPYDLASGIFGSITEVFTPYYDVDNDGDYDEEVDCLGDPITLVYNIYELPSVIATPDADSICSEGTTSIALSSDVPNTTFAWVVQATTGSVSGQADGSGNSIAQTISGFGSVTYRVTPTGPAPNNCVGEFLDVVVIVEPPVSASITADDYLLCEGGQVTFTFNETNYPGGTEFTIDADTITDLGTGHITIPFVTNGDDLTLTEGVDFHGNLTVTNIVVTVDGTPACVGELADISISINPPFTPVIDGPNCVHVGAQMQLTADNGISLPGTFASGVWTSTPNVILLDTFDLDTVLVTGYVTGTASVYYTVTDNAGCVSTDTFVVEVLEPLTLEHVYTGDPVTCGEEFTVSVEVSNFCDINTIDYPFTWDGNAFQLVGFDTPTQLPGGTFNAFSPGPGELYLIFNDDFDVPYGNDLADSTVVLTYTLRAIGASDVYNIPDNPPPAEAYNGSFQLVPVNTEGVSVPIESISLELVGNPEVCPSDDFAHLLFTNVVGNPNYYVINFDAAAEAAGFPDVQEGTLVVLDGEIIIPLPNGLTNGSYNAVLVVSDNTYGCVSDEYEFSIVVDTVPPTASNPATVYLSCISDIPAADPSVVIDEADNCSDAADISVIFEDYNTTGTGCGIDTMYVYYVYSVTDEAGNSIEVTHTIKVVDNLPPTVSTTGLATWYPTGAAAITAVLAHANSTKSDNCTPLLGINVALGAVDTAGCVGTIQLIVTDACGNLTPFANSLYTVNIDRQKPTVVAGNIDDCYDEDETPTAPYFANDYAVQAAIAATTATDDCDLSLNITATVSGTDCDLVIEITATDDCGKSNSVIYHTRVENDAPIISPFNPLALDGECFTLEQDALDAAIAATHAGDDCTAPGDLQYDAFTNGGCPAEIMVVVTDYCGNPSTITYTGVYIDTEDPTVDPEDVYPTCFETEAQALDSLAKAANPSDNCSDLAELLASAKATYTGPPCEQTVTITFKDHCGRTVSYPFTGITIDDEDPTGFATEELVYACRDDVDDPEVTAVYISADDNCGVDSINFYADNLPDHCGTGTRTYIVKDCAGNTTLVDLTIIINDEIAPEWLTTPSDDLDRTFLCGEDISAALALEPEAQDPNCGDVTVTLISDVTGGGCTDHNRTRTWTVVDACGNEVAAPFTQVITIVDESAPTWITYAGALDISVECNNPAGLAAAQAMAPEASDACTDFTLEKTSGVFVASGGCPQEGTYTNTWIATDDCGNASAVYTQIITITDNTGPNWVTPQGLPYPNGLDFTIACDDVAGYDFANSLSPSATDNCDVNVDMTNTTPVFTPGGCLGEGTITKTWTATDDCGNQSVLFTQTITLVDNTPPTFDPGCQFMPATLYTSFGYDCPQTATVTGLFVNQEIDQTYSWNVAGLNVPPLAGCIFDNCTDPSTIIIKVVSIDNQYDALHCSRTVTISFQLRDNCGNVQPTLFVCIYNIIDDTKPVATGGSIGTCYATETAALAAALAATTVSDNCTAPNDLIKTAVRSGTLCAATIKVIATDCAGNVSDTITYSTRIDNAAPTMVVQTIPTCYPNVAAAQAAAIAATTITDDCDAYGQLTITATTTGDCPATVTVSATDQCGYSNSVTYTDLCIGTSNSVMITTPAANDTTSCESEAADLATWLANHGGAVASGSGIVWTYTPDPIVFGMPSCTTHMKSVAVTFKATDGCGYMATTTASFFVSDNTAPTANPIPNTTLSCLADTLPANINVVTGVHDNCDDTLTVALFANTKTGTGCPGSPLIIARTYSVTDDYCNTTYITQMITVVDNVAPTFTGPVNTTIQAGGDCAYNASPAVTGDVTNEADNCTPSGPGLQAYFTDVINPGVNHPDKFIITRTWHLLDACGNAAIPRVQTITVQDLIPPTIGGCPANSTFAGAPVVVEMINYPCAWTATGLTSPVYNDNCPGAVLSYHLDGFFVGAADGIGSINGKTFLEGTTTVTYTVTDGAGNTVSCSFTVTVNCLTISGRIIWEHNGTSGVKDATVNGANVLPTPPFMGSDLSDANGNYDISVPMAGTYRLTPVKNTGGNAGRMNGVDAADATRITNHVNFSNPITNPYKKVCADVNRSGIINTQDATLITQCIAGNPTAQAVFNVFWRFVPTTFVMPNTAHQNVPVFPPFKDVTVAAMDVLGVNFFGMKIGDVDTVWANPQNAPSLAPLVWVLQDQTLVVGTELELTFTTSNFNNLAAYQFALDFDPTQLQFVGFQPLGTLPMNLLDNFGSYNADMGELRNVWSSANGTTLADGTQVFRAKFKVLASGQKLSEVLKLDDSEIPCKAYSAALVPTEMKLVFTESVGTDMPVDPSQLQLQLMQNRPNPFTDATTIGFILPEACAAHIRILDISGRELTSYDRNYTAGYHELDFRMENATSYGVLFCELLTPQGKRTIKMITAK